MTDPNTPQQPLPPAVPPVPPAAPAAEPDAASALPEALRPEPVPVDTNNAKGDGLTKCPRCGSARTEELSRFGSTPCKSLHRCLDCREPFDRFKCH